MTRKRLYIESMEAVLSETNKVLVDVKAGNNLLYLPLDKMMTQHQSSLQLPSMSAQTSVVDQSQVQQQAQPVAVQEQAVERTSIRSREARGR